MSLFLTFLIFFLFLLFEFVLLEDLPEFPELGLVVEGAASDFLEVASASHCSFVVFAQFSVEHDLSYLNVSQSLVTPAQHKIAACQVIEHCCCLHVLYAQNTLADLTGLEEGSRCQAVLLHFIKDLTQTEVG